MRSATPINSVKQAAEFGLTASGQELAALLMQLTDVHAIGLPSAKGLYLTEGFYWDTNDGTRKFADRFAAQMDGRRPTANQAASMPARCITCARLQPRTAPMRPWSCRR